MPVIADLLRIPEPIDEGTTSPTYNDERNNAIYSRALPLLTELIVIVAI